MIYQSPKNFFDRRSSLRIFSFLFLVMLATGIAIAPSRVATAQTPSAPAAEPEQPKTQEEQNEAFKLEGPVVKWTANHFNLKRETAAAIFEFTNFAIIVLLVGIPIVRVLPKIFRQRSQTLTHNLKTAREATVEANARLSVVEAKLAGMDEEIRQFRAQVEQESLEDEKRIKASIAEESARIVESAEQELNAAAAHARRSLRNFATDLAIEQAAAQLKLTPDTDRALIAEFIGGVSRNGTEPKGGQK